MSNEPGRRERKKAATRRSIADAALRLFLERGYDNVTVAEIAAEADTAVTTLFAHFPGGKPALVFGGDEDRGAALAAAVRGRPDGTDVLGAVEAFIHQRGPFGGSDDPELRTRLKLVVSTPALREYARKRWTDCEDPLTAAIAEVTGRDAADPTLRALCRLMLEVPDIAGDAPDPDKAVTRIFSQLRNGWDF